jgi:SAM-dependent methyltransferase
LVGDAKLTLTHASLATVDELFRYKAAGFTLPPFPGYTPDQWGIKAHNRPWIEEVGRWKAGLRVVEVGGAYSRLPEFLGEKYGVEPWIADDFGIGTTEEAMWSRWGDPHELPKAHPGVRYVFKRAGEFSDELPDGTFDRVFSVSTLEHIPWRARLDALRDMHRMLAPGGLEIHTIDIPVPAPRKVQQQWLAEKVPPLRVLNRSLRHDIAGWIERFERTGVRIKQPIPSILQVLDRSVLVESPDVVYRFYPPNDKAKPYRPAASLLLVIKRHR